MNITKELKIAKLLKDLGITPKLKGYEYLKYGVYLVCNSTQYVGHLTTKLYPEVAEYYQTTKDRVERCIRTTIDHAWIMGDMDLIKEVFGYSVSAQKGKPTNGEFIMTIADYMKLIFQENSNGTECEHNQ